MAKPTNTQDRYDITLGVREDLTDFITNVDPDETPVISSISKASAMQTFHEYQRDILASPNADNAAIDGGDITSTAVTPPTRVGNYTQIFTSSVGTSGTAEAVKKAGRASQMAYNVANKMVEMKRDIEAAVLSNNVAAAGATGTARKLGGLGVHIYTNALHNGAGATTAHTSGAPTAAVTAGTNRTFVGSPGETLLKTAAAGAFNAAGKAPSMVVMSASHKQAASAFAGISAQRTETGRKAATVIGAADYYLSDFGLMAFVPHYIMYNRTDVFGIDPASLRMAFLRGYRDWDLAKTGDADRKQVLAEVTLEVRSEKNMFKIANLTP